MNGLINGSSLEGCKLIASKDLDLFINEVEYKLQPFMKKLEGLHPDIDVVTSKSVSNYEAYLWLKVTGIRGVRNSLKIGFARNTKESIKSHTTIYKAVTFTKWINGYQSTKRSITFSKLKVRLNSVLKEMLGEIYTNTFQYIQDNNQNAIKEKNMINELKKYGGFVSSCYASSDMRSMNCDIIFDDIVVDMRYSKDGSRVEIGGLDIRQLDTILKIFKPQPDGLYYLHGYIEGDPIGKIEIQSKTEYRKEVPAHDYQIQCPKCKLFVDIAKRSQCSDCHLTIHHSNTMVRKKPHNE